MKIFKLFYFVLLILLYRNCQALDTNAVKYYPLKIGNYWVYNWANGFLGMTRYWEKVIDTTVTNGHKYYKVRTLNPGGSNTYDHLVRIDSSTGSIRTLDTTTPCQWLIHETEGDSLSARFRDSAKYYCGNWYRCTDDSSYVSLFGSNRRQKVFSWSNYFELGDTRKFVRDIGFYYDYSFGGNPNAWTSIYLRGCIINGILYGDTSLTGIIEISSKVPDGYSLFQNYPNPFNPTTKFKIQIAKLGHVKVSVFDVLGREVATLVNEQLKPGSYEVEWNGSIYPSGVYFYKLITDSFSETKKMVLIK